MRVKANLNVGNFRAGKVYEVDEEWITALVGVGYFTEVPDGRADNAGTVPVSDDDVVVSAPKRRRKVEAPDGASEADQG